MYWGEVTFENSEGFEKPGYLTKKPGLPSPNTIFFKLEKKALISLIFLICVLKVQKTHIYIYIYIYV